MKTTDLHERINDRARLVKTRNYFISEIKKGWNNGVLTYDPNIMSCLASSIGNVYRLLKPTAIGRPIYFI